MFWGEVKLEQPNFRKAVASVLTRTQVNPKALELSVAAEEVEEIWVLNALIDLGLNLALHGFGEGKASLGIFETVPLSSVSLSPSLTRKLCQPLKTPHYAVAVVSCLVTIAQLLDFDVVACGTDDNEQVRSLRACYSRERSMRLLYA
jgi:EAL domain-containing protein (putative c-di-GMP-specific phosphodiesterase class I)